MLSGRKWLDLAAKEDGSLPKQTLLISPLPSYRSAPREGEGGLLCGGCRKKEGRDVPSEDACSAVTEETCHLLVPGTDPPAAGGGRQAGEAAGRSGSDEIKAGLGSSLMPISRHVLNTSQLDAPGRSCGRKAEGRELLSRPTAGGSVPGLEQAPCGVPRDPKHPSQPVLMVTGALPLPKGSSGAAILP